MNQTYYYVADGKSVGPYSIEELMMQPITPDTYVWTKGLVNWVKLTELPEVYQRYLQKDLLPQIPTEPMVEKQENKPIFSEQFTNKHKEKADTMLVGCLGTIAIIFIIFMVSLCSPKDDDTYYPVNDTDSAIDVKETVEEFPDFRYSIILRDNFREANEMGVKKEIVFIKVNSCDDKQLDYLLRTIYVDEMLFPRTIKNGYKEIRIFYEFKIFLVEHIAYEVDLKNVSQLMRYNYNPTEIHKYLRNNVDGFCAMLYKNWASTSYSDDFNMTMRP